jgi:hypothetical protein
VLKPLTVHQRLVDSEVLEAIETLDEAVQSLSLAQTQALRRLDRLEAQLRELRRDHRE